MIFSCKENPPSIPVGFQSGIGNHLNNSITYHLIISKKEDYIVYNYSKAEDEKHQFKLMFYEKEGLLVREQDSLVRTKSFYFKGQEYLKFEIPNPPIDGDLDICFNQELGEIMIRNKGWGKEKILFHHGKLDQAALNQLVDTLQTTIDFWNESISLDELKEQLKKVNTVLIDTSNFEEGEIKIDIEVDSDTYDQD